MCCHREGAQQSGTAATHEDAGLRVLGAFTSVTGMRVLSSDHDQQVAASVQHDRSKLSSPPNSFSRAVLRQETSSCLA